MRAFAGFDRLFGYLIRALTILGATAVLGLLFHVVVDVSMRYFFNRPIKGTLEYVSFWWMVPISLFGFAAAQRSKEHIAVPIVVERLNPTSQKWILVSGNILTMILLSLLIYFGVNGARQQMLVREYVTDVAIWPLRFFVPIALSVFVIQLLIDTVRIFIDPDADEGGEALDGGDSQHVFASKPPRGRDE